MMTNCEKCGIEITAENKGFVYVAAEIDKAWCIKCTKILNLTKDDLQTKPYLFKMKDNSDEEEVKIVQPLEKPQVKKENIDLNSLTAKKIVELVKEKTGSTIDTPLKNKQTIINKAKKLLADLLSF